MWVGIGSGTFSILCFIFPDLFFLFFLVLDRFVIFCIGIIIWIVYLYAC